MRFLRTVVAVSRRRHAKTYVPADPWSCGLRANRRLERVLWNQRRMHWERWCRRQHRRAFRAAALANRPEGGDTVLPDATRVVHLDAVLPVEVSE